MPLSLTAPLREVVRQNGSVGPASGTVIDSMSSSSGTTGLSATCTVGTTFDALENLTFTRVTMAATTATFQTVFTNAVDCSKAIGLSFWVRWNKLTEGATDTFLRVYFTSDTGLTNFSAVDSQRLCPGWNYVFIPFGLLPQVADANYQAGTGWANKAQLKTLGIRAFSVNTGDTLDIYNLTIGQMTRPILMLGADDNLLGTFNEWTNLAKPLGIPMTMYSVRFWAFQGGQGSYTQYMNESQLDTMYRAGCQIGNHSFTHPNMTGYSVAQALEEYGKNQDWLISRGYVRDDGHRHVAYPFGVGGGTASQGADASGEANIRTALNQLGVLTARTTDARGATPDPCAITQTNRLQLRTWYPTSSTTTADVDAAISPAIARGSIFMICLHDILSSPTGLAISPAVAGHLFRRISQYRDAGIADVMTMAELYKRCYVPPTVR